MKKINRTLWLTLCAAAAMTATLSCSQDEMDNNMSAIKGNVTLTAGFEGAGSNTRVVISSDDTQAFWEQNDAFELFYTESGSAKTATFTTETANGTATSATFTGTLDNETAITPAYAVYPSSSDSNKPTLSGSTVTVTLPATITDYSKCPIPMYAPVTSLDAKLQFKHLAGILKITLTTAIPQDAAKLVLTADKPISGSFTADLSGEAPVLSSNSSQDGDKKVTITVSQKDAPTTFYIPVPAETYTSLKAELQKTDGTAIGSKEWTGVTVARAALMRGSFGIVTIEAGTEETGNTSDVSEKVTAALPEKAPEKPQTTNLEVTGTIDATQGTNTAIVIPPVQNSNVELSLATVPTTSAEQPLKLANEAEEGGTETAPAAAVNQFVYAQPAIEDQQTAPYLEITMPKTTVVLQPAAGAESTTFEQVTATTATNTLVIGQGVTVKKVIVKGGNLKVVGKVEALERAATNEKSVYVVKGENAELPTSIPEGFVIVENEAELNLRQAAAEGGEVVLNEDITLKDSVKVEKDKNLVLDLNGHTISSANKAFGVFGTMTVKDAVGTGMIKTTSSGRSNGLIRVWFEDAKFILEGGTIDAKAANGSYVSGGEFGVCFYAGADVDIKGGKIEAGWYALSGNGNSNIQNSIINITGGELISTMDYAVYLPQTGTTNISGGTIKGAAGGICMQRATLNISGTAVLSSDGTGNTGNWTDGTGNTGNATLAIVGRYGDCTVNISGGNFSATGDSQFLIKTGGSYARHINITGGTFSDPEVLNYLAANANVDITLNRTATPTGYGYKMNAVGATATVNLNGYDIINTTEEVDAKGYGNTNIFNVYNGTLNIEGEGNVKCDASQTEKSDGYRMAVTAWENGIININGGSYYNKQKLNTQIDLIYAIDNGTINISGGTFESGCYGTPDNDVDGRYWVLNIKNASKETANINVTGGTFINFNPSCPNMDDKTPYTVEGYETVRDGEVYTEAHKLADDRKVYTVRKAETKAQ